MGLEIALHFEGGVLPDVIVYPTGGGTGLVGIWKAFEELVGFGLLDPARTKLPRMVAVQSANCAPVVEAFEKGLDDVVPVTSRGTVADGLDVPGAIMGHGILRALRASGGCAVAVPEEAISTSFERLGRLGIAAGLESAATLAALEAMRSSGTVRAGERVMLLLTGSHLIPLARELPLARV
jgi:threonine synthase